jgi:NAD(P)H dehydrogenase (quinone)
MHALVVLAHPEGESFTAALARTIVETLEAAGHTVDYDDLSASGFRADAGWHDVQEAPNGMLQVMAAQGRAAETSSFAPDVAREIKRLQDCDLLITVFPFWWFSPPAQLKGWFDRVFANGIAYGSNPYDDGPLRGKRALAVVTAGGDAVMYGPEGRSGDMRALLNPVLHGTFGYCAFDVLDPFIVYEADGEDAAVRERALVDIAARLQTVATEAPIRTEPLRSS